MFEDVKGRLLRLERADGKSNQMFVFSHKTHNEQPSDEEQRLRKRYPNALFVIVREKDRNL